MNRCIVQSTRFAIVVGLLFVAAIARAQLVVTSPVNGDFLGRSNQIRFNITGASKQARVVATATNKANSAINFQVEGKFDPNFDNKINGSLDLNFDEATPLGRYDIVVDHFQEGSKIQTVTVSDVNIDTRNPKMRNITPANNAFVNRTVPIKATIEETNMDLWRVRVNDRDVPNNSGNTNQISVLWDTSLVEKDGSQSVSIRVEDRAKNVANRTISITLDRVQPTTAILSPTSTGYRSGTIIPVSVNVVDQFSGSVINAGVVVTLRSVDGQFLGRVARVSARSSDRTLQWTGRIRNTRSLPGQFKVVVTAVDRAGNVAQQQEVLVTLTGK